VLNVGVGLIFRKPSSRAQGGGKRKALSNESS